MVNDDRQSARDSATGIALVLIGFVFLLDRVTGLIVRYTPRLCELQQWWPLLLIGSGVAILIWDRLRIRPYADTGGGSHDR